jgi:hypothetical protein
MPTHRTGGGGMTLQSFDDVRRFTTDLETIEAWRDDLNARLGRAHLTFEFVGCLDAEDQQQLEAEVSVFNQVCQALSAASVEPIAERNAA